MPSYGFLASFGARRFPKGERKALWCARRRILLPRWGLTRRLRRGWWGCRPEGGSTFFRSERKYQRKHAARRYGKKPFIAHFDGGARNVARNGVGQLSPALGARSCSPFSAVKMGGPFSLRCLSPLCSPAVGAGHNQSLRGGMLWRSLCFFARPKASGKSNPRRPFPRAMRPVAEWRSLLCSWRESAPDPRAARPVAERR